MTIGWKESMQIVPELVHHKVVTLNQLLLILEMPSCHTLISYYQ